MDLKRVSYLPFIQKQKRPDTAEVKEEEEDMLSRLMKCVCVCLPLLLNSPQNSVCVCVRV